MPSNPANEDWKAEKVGPTWFVTDGTIICEIADRGDPAAQERWAKLIAAAPAMLRALQPFAEYGATLRGQRVSPDGVLVRLWDHKITVADLRLAADAADAATT